MIQRGHFVFYDIPKGFLSALNKRKKGVIVIDQEAKLVLQRTKRPAGGIGEEEVIISFKLKEFHITFSKIML